MSSTINQIGLGLAGSTGSGTFVGATAPTMSNVTVDNLNLQTNKISSTNSNGDIFFQTNGTGQYIFGQSSGTSPSTINNNLSHVGNPGARSGEIHIYSYVNSTSSALIDIFKSRSTTVGSFTTVQSGDILGQVNFYADNGTNFTISSSIVSNVTGAVSGTNTPSNIVLATSSSTASNIAALTINSSQVVTLANPLLGISGGTGKANTGQVIDLSSPTTGYVLTSDSSGNASWQAATPTGAVLLAPSADQTIVNHNLILTTGSYIASTVLPGNLSLTSNTLSSTNTNGDINLNCNGSGQYLFGSSTSIFTPTTGQLIVQVANPSSNGSLFVTSYTNDAFSGFVSCNKSRSTTVGSYTAVQNGDQLGGFQVEGDTGTDFSECGSITWVVDGTPTTATGVPTTSTWNVFNTSGSESNAIILHTTGLTEFTGNIEALGATYAKVNGTEASNAITLNGYCGVIKTSSLTTAGGSSYAIAWSNTNFAVTSVINISILGGTNTTQNITLTVVPAPGSATLTIYNNTVATPLNGTILIGYTVF